MSSMSVGLYVYRSIEISISSLLSLGKFCVSRSLSISSRLSSLLEYSYSQHSILIFFVSVELTVMSPLSDLILVI